MNSTTTLRVARCSVGREKYFVDLGGVASIQQSNVVAQLPTAEQPVGQLDTAQGPIPVYSLSHLLSGEFQPLTSRAYCLIIHRDGRRWGLMVDQIQQSIEITQDRLMRLPRDLHADWCLGSALPNDSLEESAPASRKESAPEQLRDPQDNQVLLVLNPAAIDGQSPLTFGGNFANATADLTGFTSSQSVTTVRQLVLFDLTQKNATSERISLALNAAQIMEVSGPQAITALPHAPSGVLGLIAWRGRAVPLLNLSTMLGLPDHVASRFTRFVIARRPLSEDYIAFIAPSALRTQILGKNQTTRRDDLGLDETRFFGAFAVGQETFLVPNLDQVFTRRTSATAV